MRASVLVGADVTKVVQVSAENASAVEAAPPKVEAAVPAVGPQPEEPAAAAESQQGSAAKPGKRQKSLFDF
jgi:hypothetical protein